MRAAEKGPGPVAYLTGQYPKASHTFIQREIAALEARGVAVLPCAIRRPAPGELTGPEERAEHARSFYVLAAARARPLAFLGAHLGLLARRPGRYLGALGRALALSPPGIRALLWQIFYFAEAGLVAGHLKRQGARRIHAHFAEGACTVALLAARLARLPCSFTLHGPADLFEPRSRRLGAKIAEADFVACISHFARAQGMLFAEERDWPRLSVVRCGVVPARYDAPPPPERPGLRLLFVGRIEVVKGIPVMLEALAEARRRGADITLELIGDGPDRARLERAAGALGGAARFLGARGQGEVAAALAEADALVLASFAEGVPVVLMEAMASRRPVVATRVGGVAELVEDGVSGFLLPPGVPGPLTEALLSLAVDPELRRRMGAAGRARVVAEFDVARSAARLEALLAGRDPAAAEA